MRGGAYVDPVGDPSGPALTYGAPPGKTIAAPKKTTKKAALAAAAATAAAVNSKEPAAASSVVYNMVVLLDTSPTIRSVTTVSADNVRESARDGFLVVGATARRSSVTGDLNSTLNSMSGVLSIRGDFAAYPCGFCNCRCSPEAWPVPGMEEVRPMF